MVTHLRLEQKPSPNHNGSLRDWARAGSTKRRPALRGSRKLSVASEICGPRINVDRPAQTIPKRTDNSACSRAEKCKKIVAAVYFIWTDAPNSCHDAGRQT